MTARKQNQPATPPAVSVIVPLHNSAATVAETLASLASQTLTDWQAIIVNDGSTDDGPSVVARLAERDTRLVLIHQKNAGTSAARNAGLDAATGRYVLLLDADDWLLPGALEALVRTAQKSEGAAVGDFEFRDERGGYIGRQTARHRLVGLGELLGSVFFVAHGHLVPRSAYEGVRFDPGLPVVEDTDVWLRLAERGVQWTHCGETVAAYRIRRNSRSADFGRMFGTTARVYRAAYERARAEAEEIVAGGVPGRPGVRTASGVVDASPARLAGVLGRAALGYATRTALARGESVEEGVEQAARMLRAAPGDKVFTGEQAGRAAYHGVLLALGVVPVVGVIVPPWRTRLEAWWARCVVEGWLAKSELVAAEDALRALAGATR